MSATSTSIRATRPRNLDQPLGLRLRSHSFGTFRSPTAEAPARSSKTTHRRAVIPPLCLKEEGAIAGDLSLEPLSIHQDAQDPRHEVFSPVALQRGDSGYGRSVENLVLPIVKEKKEAIPSARFTAASNNAPTGKYALAFGDGVIGLTGLSNLGNTVSRLLETPVRI